MIETWIQYTHLEKLYGYLPGMDEALMARLFGLGLEEYREVKGRFDANARDAARELLEDASFAGRVDRLPFRSGETVVGVGDSITDDLQSWLEIVRHLLELRRPEGGIRVVNAGLSAHTTAMVLRRFVPHGRSSPHRRRDLASARRSVGPPGTRISTPGSNFWPMPFHPASQYHPHRNPRKGENDGRPQ